MLFCNDNLKKNKKRVNIVLIMEITLRCQINGGVLINGGRKLFEEFNERGGFNKRGDFFTGEGES